MKGNKSPGTEWFRGICGLPLIVVLVKEESNIIRVAVYFMRDRLEIESIMPSGLTWHGRRSFVCHRLICCLVVLLFLTACGQAEPFAAEPPPEDPVQDAPAVQEEEGAWTEPLWTVDVSGGTIVLRDGTEPGTWDLWLEGAPPVLLTTLQESGGSYITAQPFTGILGHDGFTLRHAWSGEGGFGGVLYYILEEDSIRLIAHSFGFFEDYAVDLDGDGITELVTVNTYGGDGYREVRVLRRQGDSVEIGMLDNWPELPDHDDWGVNSTAQNFDPERQVFQIQYDLKDTHPSEEWGLVETGGLEWFSFEVFDEDKLY